MKGQNVAGCIGLQLAVCAGIKPSVGNAFLEKDIDVSRPSLGFA